MDDLDDIFGEPVVNRPRAGGKFQPKAKPRPRKTSASVHSTVSTDTKENAVVLPITNVGTTQSIQPADVDNKLKNIGGSSSGVPNLDDSTKSILVNPLSQVVETNEDVGSLDALPMDVAVAKPDIDGDGNISFRQLETEADSKGLGVDPSAGISLEPVTLASASLDAVPSVTIGDGLKDPFASSLSTSEIVGIEKPNECSISNDKRSFSITDLPNGNRDPHSNNKNLTKEVDSLGLNLDPFDDNIHGHVTSNSRAGGKFQPKAKSCPRKETSTSLPSAPSNATEEKPITLTSTGFDTTQYDQPVVAEKNLTNVDGLSASTSEIMGTGEPSKNNEGPFPDKRSLESVKAKSKLMTEEAAGSKDALHSGVATCESNSDWQSSIGILSSEVDCMSFELEPFGDFYPEAAIGNGNNEGEGSLFCSEMSTLLASNNKVTEENYGIPACSSVDSSALRVCDGAEPHTCPDLHKAQDPITCREAAVSNNDGDIQIDNGRSEREFQEAGTFSGMGTSDFISQATIASGRHTGKFRPKPKMKTGKEKPSTSISHPQVESVMPSLAPQLVPSETGYMDEGSVPAFPVDYVEDNSIKFGDSIPLDPTSAIPMNEEMRNLAETSHPDGPVLGVDLHSWDVPEISVEVNAKNRKGKASTASNLPQKRKKSAKASEENEGCKSSRQLRKRVPFQLIDEPEDEANDDSSFSAEPPSNSSVDEDEDYDDEFRVESKSQKKRAPRKPKKPEGENGKPVRKRKKANEAADQSAKEPPKKFSHSTRRNRRCVDKALLETPEDEIDPKKLPIKDLILLAEHKERLASKETATSKTPQTNSRFHNSFHEESSYNGEETFASEQGRDSDDDQPDYVPSNPFINYQSFMDKTPSTRWSKQDTELFYEAVQQFGTDFAMIQQLFPGRTRHQVKLKFKKEERQYPLRLSEALANRGNDHSHFQLVIERLQQASQAEKQSKRENSVDMMGEEEVEELATQTNEEVAKQDQDEEVIVKDQETDFAEVHSPQKSDTSDDDLFNWSQYKIH